jgi:RNA polymerase sigma factor (sigma-70 family)
MLAVQPDRVLCTLALRGNAAAFEVLYTRYHRSIYAFIYHLLGRGASAEDAEDLAQDTFGSAFDKLEARRESGSFKAWLYTIARNRTFDHIKSDKTSASDELDTELEADSGASAELNAEQRAQMLWLVGALQELPERQRQALVMRELGGMSYDEIAGSIGATVPSVKQLINRARGTVTNAAALAGYSPRNLDKSLQAIAPLIPIAASSATLAAFGIGGGSAAGVSAGVGGFSAAAKVATVAATVAVVGGGAAGVNEVTHDTGSHSPAAATVTANSRHANAPARDVAGTPGSTFVYRAPALQGGSPGSARSDAVYYNVPPKPGGDHPKSPLRGFNDHNGQAAPIVLQTPAGAPEAGSETNGNSQPGTDQQTPSKGPSAQSDDDDGSVALPDYGAATPQGQAPDSEDQPCDDPAPAPAPIPGDDEYAPAPTEPAQEVPADDSDPEPSPDE